MKKNRRQLRRGNGILWQQSRRAWQFLKRCVGRRPSVGEITTPEQPSTPSSLRFSPLERIQAHLRHMGLGQRVHVRLDEDASGDFILEDRDGCVHAKDYGEAVVLIERIWLYQQ